MKLKCSCCGATLKKFCNKVGGPGDFTGGPWYTDETRLNHTAFICLYCGTIHDMVGSISRGLASLLTFGAVMPMKIVGSITPMELGMMLMSDECQSVLSARELAIRECGLKKRWINIMLERKVLGHAYQEER